MSLTTNSLRRRLHHEDIDGRRSEHYDTSGSDASDEPLIVGNRNLDNKYLNRKKFALQDLLLDDERRVQLHWTIVFSQVLSQWSQWLANMVAGSRSVIGRVFFFASVSPSAQNLIVPSLSPLQEERLRRLQKRLQVPFDGTRLEHQDALRQLWHLAYPDKEIPPLKSELWKQMGWQGTDPSTDFRGGGFISLENLIYFAEKYPASFQRLLHKAEGKRAQWEYPFAIAGVNISFMLAQMLDLQSGKPTSLAGVRFLQLLTADEMAFDNLYGIAFQIMDAQWLAKRASYMEFNEVMKSTRIQLERELTQEDISSVEDLPSYSMLKKEIVPTSNRNG